MTNVKSDPVSSYVFFAVGSHRCAFGVSIGEVFCLFQAIQALKQDRKRLIKL